MTHYDVLNIKQNASDKDIKNAYRALAKKYHPDTYKGNKSVAEEKMKQINEAYDVLSNKELKVKYDEQFNVTQSSPIQENPYRKSYYDHKTNEYRSPDPREADYRTYYNYEPEYEYEPEYDFSKLKDLFTGSKLKIVFAAIGIISILVFLSYMVNQIKLQALAIFDPAKSVLDAAQRVEILPEDNYDYEKEINIPEINTSEINIPKINNEEVELKLKEWEQEFNEWYETEGKQYEQELQDNWELFYQELINQVNANN